MLTSSYSLRLLWLLVVTTYSVWFSQHSINWLKNIKRENKDLCFVRVVVFCIKVLPVCVCLWYVEELYLPVCVCLWYVGVLYLPVCVCLWYVGVLMRVSTLVRMMKRATLLYCSNPTRGVRKAATAAVRSSVEFLSNTFITCFSSLRLLYTHGY